MNNLPIIIKEINEEIKEIPFKSCDLGDLGNIIGMVVAKYFNKELGWDKESLISGIKHGISLTDGTHWRWNGCTLSKRNWWIN